MAQLVDCLTLDFSSGYDLRVLGWSPTSRSLLSGESTSPSPLAPPPCLCILPLSQINKKKKTQMLTSPLSYTRHKNKLKMDEIVRQESIKILENTGSNLCDLGHSNFLLDTSPKARETKAKMNSQDVIKIKNFCTAKETINKTKRQPMEWEKIFANVLSDKGLIFKMYKELIKLNTPQKKNPVKKWAEDMKRHFSKEDMRMANRHMNKCST